MRAGALLPGEFVAVESTRRAVDDVPDIVVRSGELKPNGQVSNKRTVFQKAGHEDAALIRRSSPRIVPAIDPGRPDQARMNVVDGMVNNNHVGLEIQDAQLEIDQGFPGRPVADPRVDHIDVGVSPILQEKHQKSGNPRR